MTSPTRVSPARAHIMVQELLARLVPDERYEGSVTEDPTKAWPRSLNFVISKPGSGTSRIATAFSPDQDDLSEQDVHEAVQQSIAAIRAKEANIEIATAPGIEVSQVSQEAVDAARQ